MNRMQLLRYGALQRASWALGFSVACIASNAFAQSTNIDPVTGRAEPAPTASGAPSAESAPANSTSGSNASPSPAATEQPTRSRWSHRMQGELRVGVNDGYGLAIRYANGPACDAASSTFCRGRSPITMDFAAGFGALDWLEVEARFRLGVEPTNGFELSSGAGSALPMAAGLGVRIYGSETSRFKFAFGVAALLDFTRGQPLDVVARLDEGLHYDVARQFGFYVQIGESITFLRALGFEIDGGLGIQGRFP
jgi:hypothetical protein